ncbi:hypothetical protein HMPREF9004_1403 [Schaalia cardiffensis F0333]|uniref:Uncharacterized protein n=1 Tax=Schaalia cardiffensis F0333 TaxID=888050 RepID=N6X398_9ACTO|nr:hypothetical protein HMPREF9004_1403 [Schaalia cardiffensis F0333]
MELTRLLPFDPVDSFRFSSYEGGRGMSMVEVATSARVGVILNTLPRF